MAAAALPAAEEKEMIVVRMSLERWRWLWSEVGVVNWRDGLAMAAVVIPPLMVVEVSLRING